MKLAGYDLTNRREAEILVIPRGEQDIVFKLGSILNYDEFETLCKMPVAPVKRFRGGRQEVDTEDKSYKEKLKEYMDNRGYWVVIQSLKETEGLEWDSVIEDDPDTWKNIEKELREANFSEAEVTAIFSAAFRANTLTEERLEEARNRFLASRQLQLQQDEQ